MRPPSKKSADYQIEKATEVSAFLLVNSSEQLKKRSWLHFLLDTNFFSISRCYKGNWRMRDEFLGRRCG